MSKKEEFAMKTDQSTVTIQEGGQITLPHWLIEKTGLRIGDDLSLANLHGVIIARKAGNDMGAVSLLEELGKSLNRAGYNTKEKVESLIDTVKMEVVEEWENKTHQP
jgi:bifunctional DNA-binding transcriptional regulator/antitoxin component of YhaV-PrlF toxin-antitoxin module